MLTTPSSTKPLLLFHLLLNLNVDHALCFTKSIEAATRLVKLIDLFVAETGREAIRIASYSSDLPVNRRTKLLEAFKAGEIRLCVCSFSPVLAKSSKATDSFAPI